MPSGRYGRRTLPLFAMVCLSAHLAAQQDTESAAATAPAAERAAVSQDPGRPNAAAWNAGLEAASVHTSTNGWATLATPAAGYRFNDVFSVEADIPIYFYRLAKSRAAKPPANALLVTQRGEPGDVVVSGRARFRPRHFDYTLTGVMTAPTGDEAYGLTTGRVTFDISNQFQRRFGRLTPKLVFGGGDSGNLSNPLVTKMSSSLGALAHFRGGLAARLTGRCSLETDIFGEVPLSGQKIYTSKSGNGGAAIVASRDAAAHDGVYAVFDAAIDRNTMFTSYYSRSIQAGTDIVSVGLSYFIRRAAPEDGRALSNLSR